MNGFDRETMIAALASRDQPWDVLVIGGGATGVSVALDAASRGLSVALLEQSDFGKGTSSRSTKLVHGGVRYLRQGNITLVRDALRERTLLKQNAPHLVHDMAFLIPCHSWWQRFFYGVGLKIYDFLSFGNSFGRSYGVSRDRALELLPVLKEDRLRGGVVYHDGQFDDARLLINMARTAGDQGACVCNYVRVEELVKGAAGRVVGVLALDRETGESLSIGAKVVVNATGAFCDSVRRMDDASAEPMIAPSQGVHLVLPRSFFPRDTAMIVPKTSDGRVIFLIPWHDHVVVGTTDTAIKDSRLEPTAQPQEIEFLLSETGNYLNRQPALSDIESVFVGIRPLVKSDKSARTASLSRDHSIRVSQSGLLTITGGKWTTVRKMAEDCVDRLSQLIGLDTQPCETESLKIHGYVAHPSDHPRGYYGSDLTEIVRMEHESEELAERFHDAFTLRKSDVVWACRHEMARTVEDVLSRRNRALFLNAKAAIQIAPDVARLMAGVLGKDSDWQSDQVEEFCRVAAHYTPHESAEHQG